MRFLITISALALAAVLYGCGSDCKSLCDESVEGGCAFMITGMGCQGDCDLAERLAEKSGCTEQLDTWLDCEDDEADICANTCNGFRDQAFTCAVTWCASHAADPDCQALP
jgi:hypothetical protein